MKLFLKSHKSSLVVNYFCLLVFFSMPLILKSQRVEWGAGVGGLMYWGDLTPRVISETFGNLRFGAQGFMRTALTEKVDGRLNLLVGGLAGDDALSSTDWMKLRNLSFHSLLIETSAILEYNFLRFDLEQEDAVKFYLAGGFNFFHFNPKTEYQGVTYALQPLGTEGQGMPGFQNKYNLVSFGLLLGGGMKIKLTDRLSINPEFIGRMTFTDYLDDVSGFYVNYYELRDGNGDIAAALGNRQGEFLGQSEPVLLPTGSGRGGPNADDFYFVGMINFTYLINETGTIFGNRKRHTAECPTF